jgi:hypothetical protein
MLSCKSSKSTVLVLDTVESDEVLIVWVAAESGEVATDVLAVELIS